MKKIYTRPSVITIKINSKYQLLTGSQTMTVNWTDEEIDAEYSD